MEIKLTNDLFHPWKRISKFIVKTLLLLCYTTVFSFTTDSLLSQNAKVAIHSDRTVTIFEVLELIRNQTECTFIYQSDIFHDVPKVHLKKGVIKALKLLEQCLPEKDFNISVTKDNYITITRRKPKALKQGHIKIKGKITNIDGEPIVGVNIQVKGTNKGSISNFDGSYTIEAKPSDVLVFTSLGFETQEISVNNQTIINTVLKEDVTQLDTVTLISTGYSQLPKERATGSFNIVDNKLLNRSVSTNFQDRLEGVTTGMLFSNSVTVGRIETNPNYNRNLGITIRGESTFLASKEPLIVVDNFPFEGELSSINPNDIENVTILKDAAAASIWGARSGNGVIVITPKQGKRNQKMQIDFTSNITIANKPDLFYSQKFLEAKDFIEVEQYLFNQGYFNSDLNNSNSYPVVSPSVEIMALVRDGMLSQEEGQKQLNSLTKYDVRNDLEKYVYRSEIQQQYALAVKGGTDNMTYRLSAGFDHNKDALIQNGFKRVVINSLNTYSPLKGLDITAGVNYSHSMTSLNNEVPVYSVSGSKYQGIFPYTRLADEAGRHLDVLNQYRESYLVEAESKGFQDWRYRPLDELYLSDNTTKVNSLLMKISATYKVLPQLAVSLNYQNEQQRISGRNYRHPESYYVRNLINKFSVYDENTNTFTYNFPFGGTLYTTNNDWSSNILRGQLDYDQIFGKHSINALLGAEVRELKTEGLNQSFIGYDDQFGTSVTSLDFKSYFPTNPSGSSRLPGIGGLVLGTLNRFISYYANASYAYDNKYTFSLSGRQDGANLFGAKTNNRFTPLWSAGAGWKISNESFYNVKMIPYLQLRATYGFNGNTYARGTALLTGIYSISGFTGEQKLVNLKAPNSELRWERIKNINLGLDFKSKNELVTGTIEYYVKKGLDLVQPTDLAPQTGFLTYNANTASTKTHGVDANITVRILNKSLKWHSTWLFSWIKNRIVNYDAPYLGISGLGGIEGKPLNALFSYKWGGLNPENGNPIGYVDGEKSEDYAAIYNNLDTEDLVYSGSATPTAFGAFRNDISYKNFNFSFNITYDLGYYFRRPSVSTNYTGVLKGTKHTDYGKRWQQPGDELTTNVPSLVYPNNNNRDNFYRYSETLVTPGDHIRLKDIRLSYNLSNVISNTKPWKQLQVFIYTRNLGILWRKNKFGIDPDRISYYRDPMTTTIGITANF
ncbi:SusC/RagA family TonB-linked outer membrane protein [Seonamhaeicola sp. NFXS20]|uniref:SusC/RagA family TonB-linked outer membrane protein n=1 Tax=Seonamhaeicola sp. NFXS20 TaxID=2816959 RepID=UPI003B8C9E10